MIADIVDFGLKQMRQTGPLQCKRYVDLIKILPIKFKQIHVINNQKIFDIANMMIIPLLSENIRSKIVFHDDLSDLHKSVPKSILCLEHGGDMGPSTVLNGTMNSCYMKVA
ncbi:hypothetical protein HDE_07605 [Halotydeus destructor]|nr:hypothetical protein HDE_07605 [Halotydeus destructor]